MVERNTLKKAERLMRSCKYPEVISLLEPQVINFRDSFRFFFILGSACLYVGDLGGAESYFKRARQLRMKSAELMVAQGALLLRRGDIPRAVEYYLEALEYEPSNKKAKKALHFIRFTSDRDKLQEKLLSGKLKSLYPSFGVNPAVFSFSAVTCVFLVCALLFSRNYKRIFGLNGTRADLSAFVLSVGEKSHPLETDIERFSYRYLLTSGEVEEAYKNAQKYFQQSRDNAAQVEINRLLNSNASASIKYKAKMLMDYLEQPGFDDIKDKYSYSDIAADPFLYTDCWVVWSGRITNAVETEEFLDCDLLVGYEKMDRIDGIVPLRLTQPCVIENGKPLKVLGKITIRNDRLALDGKAVYQPVSGDL